MRHLIDFAGRMIVSMATISYVSGFEMEKLLFGVVYFIMCFWMLVPVFAMYSDMKESLMMKELLEGVDCNHYDVKELEEDKNDVNVALRESEDKDVR